MIKLRIGICGTHCSGKTTLVRVLSKKLGVEPIENLAHDFPDKSFLRTQFHIMLNQILHEHEYESFVSDRTVLDNMVYTTRMIEDTTIYTKKYNELIEDLISWHRNRDGGAYDYVVFVDEYFGIEDDGQRPLDKDLQIKTFYSLKNSIESFAKTFDATLIYVKGTTEERLKDIMDVINV